MKITKDFNCFLTTSELNEFLEINNFPFDQNKFNELQSKIIELDGERGIYLHQLKQIMLGNVREINRSDDWVVESYIKLMENKNIM